MNGEASIARKGVFIMTKANPKLTPENDDHEITRKQIANVLQMADDLESTILILTEGKPPYYLEGIFNEIWNAAWRLGDIRNPPPQKRAAANRDEALSTLAELRKWITQINGNQQSASNQAIHNADYTMVNWFGTEYHFALGVQSQVVRVLWEEWEHTQLGLHQETIREKIDAARDSFRVDLAFRNHPALGKMIRRCGDGCYKLSED
jgi:hypothetical protein